VINVTKQLSTRSASSLRWGTALPALLGSAAILLLVAGTAFAESDSVPTDSIPTAELAPASDEPVVEAPTEAEPSESDVAIRTARELSDEKRFDEAAATLSSALEKDPSSADLLSWLARVQAWGRHFDESIATYGKLLDLTPDDAQTRAGYARVLGWSGRYSESAREFRRAIAQDSTNLETRLGYARVLSWSGDLAGASKEYFQVLDADSGYGDAWLGLASVSRWRRAATAADAFVEKAAARGGDPGGVTEERAAVRLALRPTTGIGWTRSHEEQIVTDSTTFQLESVGGFVFGRATLGRSVGVGARASQRHLWEKNGGASPDTTLNYDLRSTGVSGDLDLLRYYPIQLSAGLAYERFEGRSPDVLFPLREDDDFLGFSSRAWGYVGRVTPSLSVRRDFIPIKETDPTTGAKTLVPGSVLNAELAATWDWNAHGSTTGSFSKGSYSDDNDRSTLAGAVAYRVHLNQPRVALDYGLTWNDFARASSSYFTPLESVRHMIGISANGYSERSATDYGARYQFSMLKSANFDDIFTNMGALYGGATILDCIPIGVEAFYSIDNNRYETWGVTLTGSVRW